MPQGEGRVVNVKVEMPVFIGGQDEISGQPAYAGRKRSKLLLESKNLLNQSIVFSHEKNPGQIFVMNRQCL